MGTEIPALSTFSCIYWHLSTSTRFVLVGLKLAKSMYMPMKYALPAFLCLSGCQLTLEEPGKNNQNADGHSQNLCEQGSVLSVNQDPNQNKVYACWETHRSGCLYRGDDGSCYTRCISEGIILKTTSDSGEVEYTHLSIEFYNQRKKSIEDFWDTSFSNLCEAWRFEFDLHRLRAQNDPTFNPSLMQNCEEFDADQNPHLYGERTEVKAGGEALNTLPDNNVYESLSQVSNVTTCDALAWEEAQSPGSCLIEGLDGTCEFTGCITERSYAVFSKEDTPDKTIWNTSDCAIAKASIGSEVDGYDCRIVEPSTELICAGPGCESDEVITNKQFEQRYGGSCQDLREWVEQNNGQSFGPNDSLKGFDDLAIHPTNLPPYPAEAPKPDEFEQAETTLVVIELFEEDKNKPCNLLPEASSIITNMTTVPIDFGQWLSFSPIFSEDLSHPIFSLIPSHDLHRPGYFESIENDEIYGFTFISLERENTPELSDYWRVEIESEAQSLETNPFMFTTTLKSSIHDCNDLRFRVERF